MERTNEIEAASEEILNRLVAQYQTPLRRMCFVILRDEELAKDAVQDTFFKAYKNIAAFRRECSEKTWLMKIAINTCRDVKRSAWFRLLIVQTSEESVELTIAIMKLPPKLKEVIILYYYQQMTTREVADVLNIPQSTVSTRLRKAKEKLKFLLEGGDVQ